MLTGHHPSIHARKVPDKAAYIMHESGEVVTYRQLDERSNQGAQVFRSWGLAVRDVVVIHAENHARFLEVIWAAQRAGLYFTAVSWHSTADEVEYILRDSGAKTYIASARYAETAVKVSQQIPELKHKASIGGKIEGFARFEDLREEQTTVPIADEVGGVAMLYTSGTTGRPKGVRKPITGGSIDEILPHEYLYYQSGYNENGVSLAPGPMYHTAPMNTAMRTNRFGGTCIVVDRFDAEEMLKIIEHYGVKQLNCVPTHFIRLLKLPKEVRDSYDVSSLQLVLHTAAPCPPDVKHQMIDWLGPIIVEYYGGTEGVAGTVIDSHEWLAHPGSIGQAASGSTIHIVDESTWQERSVGEVGVMYFEDDSEFEYHNDPEKTSAGRSPQGWKTLGDIGYLDDEGYAYLTDRKSNMIVSGGVNIYPQEAENRLSTHPKVVDVAVFGIPNPDFGEEVKAVVQPVLWEGAGSALEEELIAYCKEGLSGLKCPRSIDFEKELPRHDNGKLYKRLLKDKYQ